MSRRDIERYVRTQTGVVTDGERARTIDNTIRYREDTADIDLIEPTVFARGVQFPPGLQVADTVTVTTAVTNRTQARYLGQAPADLIAVSIRMNVTTAVATAIVWAEIGIAVSPAMDLATGADLTLSGYVDVTSTFNSTGLKTTEVGCDVSRGQHVWLVWGSQATTPFSVSGGVADLLGTGITQLATTTRPSTMADPTTFTVSTNASTAPWVAFWW